MKNNYTKSNTPTVGTSSGKCAPTVKRLRLEIVELLCVTDKVRSAVDPKGKGVTGPVFAPHSRCPLVETKSATCLGIHYQAPNVEAIATMPTQAVVAIPTTRLFARLASPSGTTVVHEPQTIDMSSSVAVENVSPSPVKSPSQIHGGEGQQKATVSICWILVLFCN